MDKIKFILDREPVSSEQISARQDFNKIKASHQPIKASVFKSSWFYGALGASAIAIPIAIVNVSPTQISKTDKKIQHASIGINISPSKIDKEQIVKSESVKHELPKVKIKDESSTSVEVSTVNKKHKEAPVEEEVEKTSELKVVEKPVKTVNTSLPHFGNYYFGEIPVEILMKQTLLTHEELAVISFNIRYFDARGVQERSIRGAKIPMDIIDAIKVYNLGEMVFITDVIAEHRSTGNQYPLSSMNFTPILGN